MSIRNINKVCFPRVLSRSNISRRAFSTSPSWSIEKDKASHREDEKTTSTAHEAKKRNKTMEQIDEEIRAAMEGRSGDGGISGAELEGGKAVAMKRGQ